MRIYIAGSFVSQERLRGMRDKLRDLGHTVSSTWLDEGEVPSGTDLDSYNSRLALKDLREVRNADCIILDALDPSTTGGRMVEWGHSLAQGAERYIVGEADQACIFLLLANHVYPTWGALLTSFRADVDCRRTAVQHTPKQLELPLHADDLRAEPRALYYK